MDPDRTVRALEALVIHGGAMTARALQAHPETSGFSVTQYRLYVHVVTADGLRVGDLARRIGARPQTTTRLIQRLVSRGLVTTERSQQDRRVVLVRATLRGIDLWTAISQRRRDQIRDALGDLQADENAASLLQEIVVRFARAVT